MAGSYITGLTALCIPHPGRHKPLWHHFGPPDRWQIAGADYPDTSFLFGNRELVDLTETFALWGIEPPLCVSASYERAVFDLLYFYVEKKGRVVPNVQPSDIDDVVDFQIVVDWIKQWEQAGQLQRGQSMRDWLNPKNPWVAMQKNYV